MEQKTNINALEGKQELTITREFDLPVELVYKAHTEPELLAQWMGTKVIKLENRNHGSYEFETSHNGNVMFKANGTIHKLVPNQEIVRTFEMENMPIGVQLEFLNFEKITADKSKLTIHVIYKSEKHRAEQLKLPFAYGINMAHNKLQEILEPKIDNMKIEEIKNYLLQNFDNLKLVEAENDLFFMHKKNDKLPFATLITKDNEYDAVSNLNREGFFRLNFCVDKDTFESLFEELPKSKKLEAYMHLGIDFTKADILLPHPTYGSMNWICIVNPSRKTFETLIEKYLKQSYQKID